MILRTLLVVVSIASLLTLHGTTSPRISVEALPLINDLDAAVQERLLASDPGTFGMSRIMVRPSLGEHFRPVITDRRDFAPVNDQERKVLAALESHKMQVGLYLFGQSILAETAGPWSHRALKGPGAITAGTPRPQWYPFKALNLKGLERVDERADTGDRLPDWKAIYPIAKRALRSFNDGGKGFEIEFETWMLAARPAIAANQKCVSCHNRMDRAAVKMGDPIGGVLYAYRIRD